MAATYIQHHRFLVFFFILSRLLHSVHTSFKSSILEKYFRGTKIQDPLRNSMMAQAFLSQLLTAENRVESEANAQCSVCLQEYGTLTQTGAIECEVRLPCNHRLGSMCAFTWLKSNNTCPLCRKDFFPAQPRPYLEHGISGNVIPNPPVATRVPETLENDQEFLSEIVRYSCSTPDWDDGLSADAFRIAEPMAEALRQRVQAEGFGLFSIAGTSVYIVSHLLGRPRSHVEISRMLSVEGDGISSLHTHIYADRETLIDPSMLEVLGKGHMDDVLAFLPLPDSDEDMIENEYETSTYPVNAQFLRSLCCRFCYQLGHRGSVVRLVQQIADAIREGSYPGVRFHIKIIAVSIFIALHLMGLDTSYEQIQRQTGVVQSTIQDSYRRLYPQRNHLVNSSSLEYIGRHDRSRALSALTSLSWPPLHPEITNDPSQNESQSEDDEVIHTPIQDDHVLQMYRRECGSFCAALGLSVQATNLCYRIALVISSEDRVNASPLSIEAVSIYIATRIIGRLVSYEEISTVVGLSSDAIRAYYRALARRDEIIEGVWLVFIGNFVGNNVV